MGYEETLNLPKTDFPMKAELSRREGEILSFWKRINLYDLIRRAREGKPKFILHDGPPYANGEIHLGHALNKILKDFIVRLHTQFNYDAPFVPGWDCHGLPIEHRVLQEKKDLKSPSEIRAACHEYASFYINVQKGQFERLGVIGDWERPYVTLDKSYSASVLRILSAFIEEGYVYRSLKPVYWCCRCQTAEAEAEIEYYSITSPSIFVKFPILKGEGLIPEEDKTYFLVWTTTPWTLPANVAICLHPNFEYSLIKVNEEYLILAKACLKNSLNSIPYELIKVYKAKDLENILLRHPFIKEREVKIVYASYVREDLGTGCVHIAPGHGIEDYETGLAYNLEILSPIDERGYFDASAPQFIKNLPIKLAEEKILEKLSKDELLFRKEEIEHEYPHCWRCKSEVIFRATYQWFLDLEKNNLKEKILKEISKVKWIPRSAEERFSSTLKSRSSWCISRQRAWGVPLPSLECKDCGNHFTSSKLANLAADIIEKEGKEVWFSEDFLPEDITCPTCKSKNLVKDKDILDVWLESGISFYPVLILDNRNCFPADLYLEGSDQHRGWFQSAIIVSYGFSQTLPYKGVLTHGFVLDESGCAMHKSMGNVLSPQEIIDKFGADILRLWVASVDYRQDVRLGESILKSVVDAYRKIRNTARFALANLYDFDPSIDRVDYGDLYAIDKWALHTLQKLIEEVKEAYLDYKFYNVFHLILEFCTKNLSAIYFDILKDRLYVEEAKSIKRRAAQTVIYEIIVNLTKLLAPILVFTAEEIWQHIPSRQEESVHLSLFPEVKESYLNYSLKEDLESILFNLRHKAYLKLDNLRKEKELGSSLEAEVEIYLPEESFNRLLPYKDELASIFIVSSLKIERSEEEKLEIKKAEGKKCMRCWNYSTSVGENEPYLDLCTRCFCIIKNKKNT